MAQCDSYVRGECTWGACHATGWAPEGLGDAYQWADRAAAKGYSLTTLPTFGSIVVYRPGRLYSDLGHVGVVNRVYSAASFDVYEMNYAAWNVYDTRTSDAYSVIAFILPPGVAAGAGTTPPWLALPNSVHALELSWGRMQTIWSRDVDTVVNGSLAALATLDAMRQQ
jgi:hypothetical protein